MQVQVTAASFDVAWLYAGMLPFLRWESEAGTTVVDTLTAEGDSVVVLSDYAGQTDDQVDFPMATVLGVSGAVPEINFVYGFEAGALPVAGNRLDQFDAFVLPNIDGRIEGGAADWPAKAYVRAHPPGGVTWQAGDVASFYNRHVLSVAG